jgi:hypothetical protein
MIYNMIGEFLSICALLVLFYSPELRALWNRRKLYWREFRKVWSK